MDCASILSPLDANLLAILIGGTIPELPAMIAAGGTMAWLVYLHLGLRLVVGS